MSGSPSKRCSTPFTVNFTMSLVLSSRSLKDLGSTELGRNGAQTQGTGCQVSPRPNPRRQGNRGRIAKPPYVILRRTWQGRKRGRAIKPRNYRGESFPHGVPKLQFLTCGGRGLPTSF